MKWFMICFPRDNSAKGLRRELETRKFYLNVTA